MTMVAFKNHVRHSEADLIEAIEFYRSRKKNPAHWESRLRDLREEQLRQERRRKERAEKAAGASQ